MSSQAIRFALLASITLLVVGCAAANPSAPGSTAVPTAIPAPASTAEPGASTEPSEAAATPADQEVPALFKPFDDVTFRPVDDETSRGFAAALTESISEVGSVGDVQLAEAMRGDEPPVLAAAFTLVPGGSEDEQQLFRRVTDDMAAALGTDWVDALDGTALKLETPDQTIVVLPWGTVQDATVFLMTSGDDAAAVERVAAGLADG